MSYKTKKCLNCQKEYQPKTKSQKFCSHKCRCSHYYKTYYKTHPKRKVKKITMRRKGLKYRYNLSLKDYQSLLKSQNGVCAICGRAETRKNRYGGTCQLHIDHDHKTKKVRGLLCSKCNAGLGLFNDDIKLLKRAIKYLLLTKTMPTK